MGSSSSLRVVPADVLRILGGDGCSPGPWGVGLSGSLRVVPMDVFRLFDCGISICKSGLSSAGSEGCGVVRKFCSDCSSPGQWGGAVGRRTIARTAASTAYLVMQDGENFVASW